MELLVVGEGLAAQLGADHRAALLEHAAISMIEKRTDASPVAAIAVSAISCRRLGRAEPLPNHAG